MTIWRSAFIVASLTCLSISAVVAVVPRTFPSWTLYHVPVLSIQAIAAKRDVSALDSYAWHSRDGGALCAYLLDIGGLDAQYAGVCFKHLVARPDARAWGPLNKLWLSSLLDGNLHSYCLEAIAASRDPRRFEILLRALKTTCHEECRFVAQHYLTDLGDSSSDEFLRRAAENGVDAELCRQLLRDRKSPSLDDGK